MEPDGEFYESSVDDDRGWISFRDPFYFQNDERGLLLAAGRVNEGPLVRRGCVAAMEETAPNCFRALPAVHHPQLYDDIEVPNLLKLDGAYYLIGSIREDAKIRYWHAHTIDGPWRNYYDNVLLPEGNYAGRICRDDSGILLWNFYTQDSSQRTANNLMPPPKRLVRSSDGQLRARTYEQFDQRIIATLDPCCIHPWKQSHQPSGCHPVGRDCLHLSSEAGFQAFVFNEPIDCFSMRAKITMTGIGKCGLVYRADANSHDGYYVSLDLMKGVAQWRAWGTGPLNSGEQMMRFHSLQSGYWHDPTPQEVRVRLLSFGSYHELCINENVILSLADTTFQEGMLGFYVETAKLRVDDLLVHRLSPPTQTEGHLANG